MCEDRILVYIWKKNTQELGLGGHPVNFYLHLIVSRISLVCLVPVSQYNAHKQCVFFYKWTKSFRRETVVAVNIYQPISLLVQVHVTFLSRCIHYYKRGNKNNYNIERFTLNEQKLLFKWLHWCPQLCGVLATKVWPFCPQINRD